MSWERDHAWESEVKKLPWSEGTTSLTAWKSGPLSAIVSRDAINKGESQRWHISVSHEGRIPRWEEMADAAHSLRPGVPMVIGIPPRSWWINVHPHVLHLWELHDDVLIAQWRSERKGHQPT